MAPINRKQFFQNAALNVLDEKEVPVYPYKDPINKELPTSLRKTSTGIAPYQGAWGEEQIKHLCRRTLFGVNKADIDFLKSKTMVQAVDSLLNISVTDPTPPLNHYSANVNFPDADVPLGQTWVNANENPTLTAVRRQSFKAWWMGLMINQDRTIKEKMTLFWHNHFATESTVIQLARFTYDHHKMLRQNCLGNFKTFARLVATDCGMLVYLNGEKNTKTAPDENFGRELQELFTVGKDLANHYTEDDVKAAARVMTGWRNNRSGYTSFFDSTKHDTTNKQFSAFYNNTVITGKMGTNGATELDDLINMIFAQEEVAKYICRKIYRFFVYYNIDASTETNVIIPLATIFRNSNYNIKTVMDTLLKSEHFYDVLNMGCVIKPPTDHLVGLARTFNLQFPDSANVSQLYAHLYYVQQLGMAFGQDIGDAPNVAGWPAYWQSPQFYELWINSDSLPKRNQVSDGLVTTGFNRQGFKLILDPIAFTSQLTYPEDPNTVISESLGLLYAVDVSANTKTQLKTVFLLSGQASDHYWSDAWNDYIADPTDTMKKQTVYSRLQGLFKYLMDLAEFQLI
ncbi:MAG: DUF1800 domain-containing protein [Bacteroidota bacterium]